jgi:hypothetical protein
VSFRRPPVASRSGNRADQVLLFYAAVFWYRFSMADVVVGLADAIAALREELLAAVDEGSDAPVRFRLEPVELSLQVGVTKGAEGKIGWQVLGLGGSYSSAVTQTLTLTLAPVWRQGDGSYSSDFTIADQTARSPRFGPQREGTSD